MTYGESTTPEPEAGKTDETTDAPSVAVPPEDPSEHNEPSEAQAAGGIINVPQSGAPGASPVYDEPGEIGIPNVVPSEYDPSSQPYGEGHGVPQPDNKVGESDDKSDDNA